MHVCKSADLIYHPAFSEQLDTGFIYTGRLRTPLSPGGGGGLRPLQPTTVNLIFTGEGEDSLLLYIKGKPLFSLKFPFLINEECYVSELIFLIEG